MLDTLSSWIRPLPPSYLWSNRVQLLRGGELLVRTLSPGLISMEYVSLFSLVTSFHLDWSGLQVILQEGRGPALARGRHQSGGLRVPDEGVLDEPDHTPLHVGDQVFHLRPVSGD